MTDAFPQFDPAALDPILSADQIALLRRFGEVHATTAGEVIWSAGERHPSLVVVLSGRVCVIDRSDGEDRIILDAAPGQFLGELNLLTGQMAWSNCVVQESGEVLIVPSDRLRVAIATVPALGDILVTTLSLRRKALRFAAANTLTLIGPPTSQSLLRVAEFVDRNRIPFRWLAPDDPIALDLLGRTEANPYAHVWVIVRNQQALADPSPLRVAKALGLDLGFDQTTPADLIVVGAGPAGLSAAVYGASEGLSTIVVDNVAIGGQAGASSRIENYLGFPTGISGGDLAFLAEVQALKFGARVTVPNNAVALRRNGDLLEVELEYGKSLRGRSVIVATGARYRTLGIPGEGKLSGVFYAATELEARFCGSDPVVVVGGGNAAGQAAMFLSERCATVHLVHRGDHLESGMSQYLIARLKKARNVVLKLGCTIEALQGADHRLRGVTIQDADGAAEQVSTIGLFIMIGAEPCTGWLRGTVELDQNGYVLTGFDLPPTLEGRPHSGFATSAPGVFAVGDVRSGSVKRVASAVGEGSVVMQAVHRFLETTPITVASS
jgi:thioredoxin reductase (NADPH)